MKWLIPERFAAIEQGGRVRPMTETEIAMFRETFGIFGSQPDNSESENSSATSHEAGASA